jgi:hypothetical protein
MPIKKHYKVTFVKDKNACHAVTLHSERMHEANVRDVWWALTLKYPDVEIMEIKLLEGQ